MTAQAFALELDREFEATEGQLRTTVRRLAFDGLGRVIEKTRVDTGLARGNWFVRVDGPGTDFDPTITDQSGSRARERGSAVIADYANQTGFPVISLFNNTPYILVLENGSTKQNRTGDFMVALTVTELQAGL